MGDLLGHVLQRPARALVVEQDAAGDEQAEAPPVERRHLMGEQLGDAVGARRAARGVLVLKGLFGSPEYFRG